MKTNDTYWKKIFGIEFFKLEYQFKKIIYNTIGLTFPKLLSQYEYWQKRGHVYMNEIQNSGYLKREIFYQDMLIEFLNKIRFDSFFEAGCGFGWNIKRVKDDFPKTRVGGVDFSIGQLINAKTYLKGSGISTVNGDNCRLPYKDNAFDVGFSLGVFMNIHPSKIDSAIREIIRVSKKYIIHLEYDETYTTEELREKRAIKTNIISHNYKSIYKKYGMRIAEFRTYKDFGQAFSRHCQSISTHVDRWEPLEGSEKYIFIVVEKDRGMTI